MTKRQICVQLDEKLVKKFEDIRDKTSMPISRQIELYLKGYIIIEDDKTQIQLRKVTIECLKKLGIKGETYDIIIKRLIHKVYLELYLDGE